MSALKAIVAETTPLDWADRLSAPYRDSLARRRSLALLRAVRLSPDLETCEELLRTGRVPKSRLNSEWMKRYGLS